MSEKIYNTFKDCAYAYLKQAVTKSLAEGMHFVWKYKEKEINELKAQIANYKSKIVAFDKNGIGTELTKNDLRYILEHD
ncbi:MAG: hypothetical protein ACKOWO_05600 [Sediminibacterium sp.]